MKPVLWLFSYLFLCSVCVGAATTVVDDTGRKLTFVGPVKAIVSLVPHATEQLFEIDAGDLIVGAGAYSNYPEAAKAIPRVGDYYTLNLEQIVSLKPDLIIALPDGPTLQQLEQLQQLGYKVFYSDPKNLQQIESSLITFAHLTNRIVQADERVQRYRTELAALRQSYQSRRRMRVFYQVWHEPIYTISGNSFINEVIEICGGVNIFKDLELPAPQIGIESVIAGRPEVIISQSGHRGDSVFPDFDEIPAVHHHALYSISADDIGRPTVNIIKGITSMCHSIESARQEYSVSK
ncbi:cobalamin-binding protein [Gynuella sp.]|uniref:cobalamin-binding protein n=1 Tax=Gynuella sp. TaxID=2969146 RepID=UPI003D1475CC